MVMEERKEERKEGRKKERNGNFVQMETTQSVQVSILSLTELTIHSCN